MDCKEYLTTRRNFYSTHMVEQSISEEQKVDKLARLLFGADFRASLDYVKKLISAGSFNDSSSGDPEAVLADLKLGSMAVEVLDYWGEYEVANELIKTRAERVEKVLVRLAEAHKTILSTDVERKLIRQQVWILLQAGILEYRRQAMERAAYLFGIAEKVCRDHVISSRDLAWGTRARIHYCIGLVHRERSEYGRALIHFTRSTEYGYKSLEQRLPASKLSYVAIAKSLALGLAFVHNVTGRPDLAMPLLLAAKSALQPLGEELISAYVDLIYANVLRGMPRPDEPEAIVDVLERLHMCHTAFRSHGHGAYQARAAYSLAIAYLQRARPDESVPLGESGEIDLQFVDKYIDELRTYTESSKDLRAEFNRQVLRSRVARKRDCLQDAEQIASQAIQLAERIRVPFSDALIARGETRARLGNYKGATFDFEQTLSVDNNRIRALGLLNLCRLLCWARMHSEAERRLSEFEKIKGSVNNMQISVLEQSARAALQHGSRDLVLCISDRDISAKSVEIRARQFLVDWARAKVGTDAEAAQLLGVSRQTFYNWVARRPLASHE